MLDESIERLDQATPIDSAHALPADMRLCLTGATGVLGSALMERLAARLHRDVLIGGRSRRGRSLDQRVHAILAAGGIARPESWLFSEADLSDPVTTAWETSLRSFCPDVVVHAAADTSLGNSWDCDRINRLGTAHLLSALGELPDPPLFVYISTAYVCGARGGLLLSEDDGRAADGEPHIGLYAKSKADAELLVEQSGLPYLILRPSVLVSDGGRANWVRELSRAAAELDEAPADPDVAVDIIPLDLCIDAILGLLAGRVSSGIYSISAGERSPSCRDLVRFASGIRRRPAPLLLKPPSDWDHNAFESGATREQRYAFARIAPLLSYLNLNATFCNRKLFEATGLRPPEPPVLERMVRSIIESPDR